MTEISITPCGLFLSIFSVTVQTLLKTVDILHWKPAPVELVSWKIHI